MTPGEQRWLERLQKVVDSCPPNTWVYLSCGGFGMGGINLMRLKPDGKPAMLGKIGEDGFDPAYRIGFVDAPGWDGGDW
jgi:hypothetical protein